MQKKNLEAYWRKNIRYVLILLAVWFAVSYGAGILWADELNQYRMGGFKLGFWFAQQGAIYVFVVIIFVYVWLMNRLDREYEVDEEETPDERALAQRGRFSKKQSAKPNPTQPVNL
jgi:putative solute:sodium symporter small subunit